MFSVISFTDSSKNLFAVTHKVVGSFFVTHDVNQLEVFSGEQQAVEVVQVDVGICVISQHFQQSGDDCPLLLDPGRETEEMPLPKAAASA